MNSQNTNKESAMDLASHVLASTELIARLLKRPRFLLPEQKVSSLECHSATRSRGHLAKATAGEHTSRC